MKSYMVMATFRSGTSMDEVLAVVHEEQVRLSELQAQGKVGALYLATAVRQTVFLEVFASNPDDVEKTVATLPMAKWWDLDVYPLNPPAGTARAS
jgi:muconolactone delta-isomerase